MSFSKERIILPGYPGRRGLYQASNLERGLVSVRLLRHCAYISGGFQRYLWMAASRQEGWNETPLKVGAS